jgi:hypothetical protein
MTLDFEYDGPGQLGIPKYLLNGRNIGRGDDGLANLCTTLHSVSSRAVLVDVSRPAGLTAQAPVGGMMPPPYYGSGWALLDAAVDARRIRFFYPTYHGWRVHDSGADRAINSTEEQDLVLRALQWKKTNQSGVANRTN